MTASLGLLAVFWAAAQQLPIATQAQLPTGETAELAAEQLLYDPTNQSLVLRGNTLLKTEGLTLRADELTYDQKTERAAARGKVMLVARGGIVAVADEITVDIKSLEATVKGGLFMQKRGVEEAALLAAKTPDELKRLGENVVTLSGERIRKTGDQEFTVDGIAFTPCDCKPSEPSWRVEAAHAQVEVGEAAVISWPKLYVYDVPIFALPWVYIPLSERRTGLLVPVPRFGGLNRFSIEQPLFVTLGRSYDLTLTPGYFLGAGPDRNGNLPAHGVAGPRLHTEFRYAPTETMRGRIALAGIYDLRPQRDVFEPWRMVGRLGEEQQGGAARGLRGELSIQHTHDMGGGWSNRADMSFVSDGYYTRDLQADVLLREVPYLRSSAVLFHRGEDHYAGADVTLRQDLRWGFSVFGNNFLTAEQLPEPGVVDVIRGEDVRGSNTFHRLPALTFGIPDKPLWGPLFGGLDADFVRTSPIGLPFSDDGRDGVFDAGLMRDPVRRDADGQGNGVYDEGERESRMRMGLRPELSAELLAGSWLRARPYAAWRQDVYFGEYTGRFGHRGYGMVGTELSTELSRVFGEKNKVRHAITPQAELRFVPAVFGAPLQVHDEIDAAVTTLRALEQPGFLHGVVEVSQRLASSTQGVVRDLARLDLGLPFDLGYRSERRLGDAYARAWLGLDRVTFEGLLRYSLEEERLTQIAGSASLNDGKGNHAYVRYDNLVVDGGDRLRRGIDTLVGPPSLLRSPLKRNEASTRSQLLVAGGRYQFPLGIHARYEAVVQPELTYAFPPPKVVRGARPSPLSQQVIGVSYGPACDCWRLEAQAIFRRDIPVPDFGVNLSLSRFGSFGSGG